MMKPRKFRHHLAQNVALQRLPVLGFWSSFNGRSLCRMLRSTGRWSGVQTLWWARLKSYSLHGLRRKFLYLFLGGSWLVQLVFLFYFIYLFIYFIFYLFIFFSFLHIRALVAVLLWMIPKSPPYSHLTFNAPFETLRDCLQLVFICLVPWHQTLLVFYWSSLVYWHSFLFM